MPSQSITKAGLWLGFLLALIVLLLSNLLSWLSDDHYLWLESVIGYKWMLTISLMLIVLVLFAWYYSSVFRKSTSKPSKKELKRSEKEKIELLKSLGADEKGMLKSFLGEDRITLEIPFDNTTALSLEGRGILIKRLASGNKPYHSPHTVENSYWTIIKKDKSILD